ncbi:MAG: hypothetical protein LBS81_01800 [Endomicrobium sp.]|nr:hypothetical protein [Endomicrobium sp.]
MEKKLMSFADEVERISSKVEKSHTFIEVTVYKNTERFKEKSRNYFIEYIPGVYVLPRF